MVITVSDVRKKNPEQRRKFAKTLKYMYLELMLALLESNLVKTIDWEKNHTIKARSRDTSLVRGGPSTKVAQCNDIDHLCLQTQNQRGQKTTWTTGSVQSPELEISQLILPGLVGLVAVQGQGLLFMWETFKHSNMYEGIIFNLNLQRESNEEGRQVPPLTSSPRTRLDRVRKLLGARRLCPFRHLHLS